MADNDITTIGNIGKEIATSGYDPFTEFFTNFPFFIANEKPLPGFKQIDDYSDLPHFIAAIGHESLTNKNTLNISYSNNLATFKELKEYLLKYDIVVTADHVNQAIMLKCKGDAASCSISSKDAVKFSGPIFLQNNLNLIAKLIILDDVEFLTGDENYRLSIGRENSEIQGQKVYISNSILPNLNIKEIANLWISGAVTIGRMEFIGLAHSYKLGDNCILNIAKTAVVQVDDLLKLVDINCINIEGTLSAKLIDVSYKKDDQAELYISPTGTLIGIAQMEISHPKNLTIMQYGQFGSFKFSISSGGVFYNNGTIIYAKTYDHNPHQIKSYSFFNYREARIVPSAEGASPFNIYTDYSSGNLGAISGDVLVFESRVSGNNGGSFYNNGSIIAIKELKISDKAFLLNDKNGTIISESKLSSTLFNDLVHIYYSGGILNREGIIRSASSNLDISFLFSNNGTSWLGELKTSAKTFMFGGGNTNIVNYNGSKNTCFFFANQNNNTKSYIASSGNVSSDCIIISDMAVNATLGNLLLPWMNDTTKIITNIATTGLTNIIACDNGDGGTGSSIRFIGNWTFNHGYIGTNQALIMSDSALVSVRDSIKFNGLSMNKGSLLVVDDNGDVYVGTLWADNAKISSFGNTTVEERLNAFEKLTLEGNITIPTIENNIHLVLSDTKLTVAGDVFNKAIIEVIGNTFISAQNFAQIGQIIGNGNINIKSESFVMGAVSSALAEFIANHKFIDANANSNSQPKVNLTGVFMVETIKNATFEGAQIIADKIGIKAGKMVVVLPKELYTKVYHNWGRGHSTKENWDYILSEFIGDNGIEIVSEGGNLLYAPNFKSNVPIVLDTKGQNIVNGVYKVEKYESHESWCKGRQWHGGRSCFVINNYRYDAYPILPSFTDLHLRALKGSSFLGLHIEGNDTSTFVIGEAGKSVVAQFTPMMEVHIHNHQYKKSKTIFGAVPFSKARNSNYDHIETPILNLIESAKGLIGYCFGTWTAIGTTVITRAGNESIISIEATEGINLYAATGIEMHRIIKESSTFKFVSTANTNEVSIGVGASYSKSYESIYHSFPVESVYRGNMHLIAPNIHTKGIDAAGGFLKVEAKKWIDEAATGEYRYSFTLTEAEISKKIGIKSPLGNFINSIDSAANGALAGTPEGAINAGFAGYSAYLSAVQMMSGVGGIISAGTWISMSVSKTTQNTQAVNIVASKFNFTEIHINVDDISFTATQINAYNAYITSKNLTINSGVNKVTSTQESVSLDIDIPLSMSGSASANVGASKAKQYSEENLHFVLKVTNDLKMHISGQASIKGASISARNVDASFGELILESVKDITRTSGSSLGIGLSLDQQNKLKSISGGYNKGASEIVNEITAIIGTENIKIIVARALHLNGAMIANAQRNEDGSYTDIGNLQLTVGQLFVRHIQQYDNGITLGASIEYGRNTAKESNNAYRATFGMQEGDGTVYATVGKGNLTVLNGTYGEELNRDINKANAGIKYSVKIDTINAMYKDRDPGAEAVAGERIEKDGPTKIVIDEINQVIKKITDDAKKEAKPFADFFNSMHDAMFGKNTKTEEQTSTKPEPSKAKEEAKQDTQAQNDETEEDEDIIDLDKEEDKKKEQKQKKKEQETANDNPQKPEPGSQTADDSNENGAQSHDKAGEQKQPVDDNNKGTAGSTSNSQEVEGSLDPKEKDKYVFLSSYNKAITPSREKKQEVLDTMYKQAMERGEYRSAGDELISELFYTAFTEGKAVYQAYKDNKKAAESGDKRAQEVDKWFSAVKGSVEGLIESRGNIGAAFLEGGKEYVKVSAEYNGVESKEFIMSKCKDVINNFQKAELNYKEAINKADPEKRILFIPPLP